MADILNFKRKTGNSYELSFMRLDDETLSFKQTLEGRVELEPVAHKETDSNATVAQKRKARDWGNQELANLFRVKHLLDAAGVICEIDRGLTDEGDPWFVFCQSDGEVFIHLCRIDGKYILDNPNIERPLSGYNFTDLIADFANLRELNGEQSTSHSNDVTHRVVHLRRGGKVRLHPSALLAALVWTLYLSAEDLVLVRPEVDTDDTYDDGDFTIIFDQSQEKQIESLAIEAQQAIDDISDFDHTNLQDDLIRLEGAMLPSKDLQLSTLTAISPMGYAFGLSSIAIALGLLSEEGFPDNYNAVLTLIDKTFFSFGQVSELSTQSSDELSEETTRLDSIIKFLTELRLHHPLDNSIAHDEPSNDGHTDPSAHYKALSDLLLQNSGFFSEEQNDQSSQKYIEDTHNVASDTTPDETMQSHPDATDEQNVVPASIDEKIHISTKEEDIAALIETWDAPLHTFYLGDEYIRASFDIDSVTVSENIPILTISDIQDEQPVLLPVNGTVLASADNFEFHSSLAIEVGVTFQEVIQNVFNFDHSESAAFDGQAKDFVKTFMAKDEDIEIIVRGDDMILIDMAGFYKSADNDAPYYIMSWELNGGGTIATVGLQPDFDYFATVA